MLNSKIIIVTVAFLLATINAFSQIKITIQPDSIVNQMAAGFGCNVFAMIDSVPVTYDQKHNYRSWGGSAWGATPMATDTAAWNKIYTYLDWLGMDYIRLNLEHRIFEPQKGIYSYNNKEMLVLYKYLDYFEKKGAIVQLQEMYPNAKWLAHKKLQNNAVNIVRSGPADLEAWSNGIIALLKHLTQTKKYTCIKYFGVANEPHHSWSWWKNDDGVSSQSIIPALAILKKKIYSQKLNIPLAGPEEMFYHWEALKTQTNFAKYVDAFSYHEYMTIIDWWDSNSDSKDWYPTLKSFTKPVKTAVELAHQQQKPFFFSEHGTMHFGIIKDARGPSTFDAVFKDVEFAVRFANLGVDGFSRWSLLNRGNLDGQWGFIETFDRNTMKMLTPEKYYAKENTFFGYGLLSRFTYKNSFVVKSELETLSTDSISNLHTITFLSPSKKDATIFIVNDKQTTETININLNMIDKMYKKWFKYEFIVKDRNKTSVLINPLEIIPNENTNLNINPLSITVFSTINLKNSSAGLVSE